MSNELKHLAKCIATITADYRRIDGIRMSEESVLA
jgi:hypothetical protein